MADRVPPAVGVKVTLILQLAFTASVDPQLLVWPKSLEFVPAMLTVAIARAEFPVLLKVATCGELEDPDSCRVEKESAAGEICATPVTVCNSSEMLAEWSLTTRSSLPSPLKSPTVSSRFGMAMPGV
jgi:hypothetical protein